MTDVNNDGRSDRADSTTLDPDTANRSILRRLIIGLGTVAVICVGGYFLQQLMLPDIDLEKTRPVVVGGTDSGSAGGDLDSATPSPDLPEGAITAWINQEVIDSADHPFDPLIKVAKMSLEAIDRDVRDYTTTMVSEVFADDKLQGEKYVECKIRHQQNVAGKEIPFSVYMNFLKPKASAGQEVIWVQGQNDGNLIAHAAGLLNVKRGYLDPDGSMAMKGNRYPIRDVGIRNLVVKMIEFGEKARHHDESVITIKRNVDVCGRTCSLFQVVHPVKRDHYDFHIARIYLDDQWNMPVAFEAYLWPEEEGGEPTLLEKYYYTDLKLNVGLTDLDFDPDNEAYNYPGW